MSVLYFVLPLILVFGVAVGTLAALSYIPKNREKGIVHRIIIPTIFGFLVSVIIATPAFLFSLSLTPGQETFEGDVYITEEYAKELSCWTLKDLYYEEREIVGIDTDTLSDIMILKGCKI